MAQKKIKAIMIVEVVGRPAEHIKKSLEEHVSKIDKEKRAVLTSLSISEPKKIDIPEQKQELYSCFAEIEVEVETMGRLIELILDYMPSSIEVLEPSEITFPLNDATAFLNDLSGRLHRYDEIAKIAQVQTQQLNAKLQMVHDIIVKDPELRKLFNVPENVPIPKTEKTETSNKPEKVKKSKKKK